jgi:phosphate transport system substrate-binding protein
MEMRGIVEMKPSKNILRAACCVSAIIPGMAHANTLLPQAELRGVGASTAAEAEVRLANCTGNPGNHISLSPGNNLNPLGSATGMLVTISPGFFGPAIGPFYDCATQEIQPDFEEKFIANGAAVGRAIWANIVAPPINPFGIWPNAHYALSDVPATTANLTTYATNAANPLVQAGPAIQFPKYVIPIALAYNPEYGQLNTLGGTVSLTFNVKFPQTVNGVAAGGLRLSRTAYCKIFNGEITNWNDPLLKTLNGNLSLMNPNDSAARWTAEGVPIRLVGHADRSGSSANFARALAAQCSGLVSVNKFQQAAESLPFDNSNFIDIRPLRSNSGYYPGSPNSNFSNTVQSLGGLVYDKVTDNICNWNEVNNVTKVCDSSLAPGGIFTNALTPGLFLVADESSGVSEAIESTANNTLLTSGFASNVKLNGKFGYVSADFVKPAAGHTLFSAALQKAATASYSMPSAANALLAFGTVLPPKIADPRSLGSVDPFAVISGTNPGVQVTPADPRHWAAVIYNPNVPITSTIAAPATGYPITGVTFQLQYTCYKPANPGFPGNNPNRFAIVNQTGLTFGQVTKNSTGSPISPNVYKGTGATSLGILAQSNIAVPPTAWTTAIWGTFFKKSVGALGALNLWIQDSLPTSLSPNANSNPACNPATGVQ